LTSAAGPDALPASADALPDALSAAAGSDALAADALADDALSEAAAAGPDALAENALSEAPNASSDAAAAGPDALPASANALPDALSAAAGPASTAAEWLSFSTDALSTDALADDALSDWQRIIVLPDGNLTILVPDGSRYAGGMLVVAAAAGPDALAADALADDALSEAAAAGPDALPPSADALPDALATAAGPAASTMDPGNDIWNLFNPLVPRKNYYAREPQLTDVNLQLPLIGEERSIEEGSGSWAGTWGSWTWGSWAWGSGSWAWEDDFPSAAGTWGDTFCWHQQAATPSSASDDYEDV
jgi:hypothetical protein